MYYSFEWRNRINIAYTWSAADKDMLITKGKQIEKKSDKKQKEMLNLANFGWQQRSVGADEGKNLSTKENCIMTDV